MVMKHRHILHFVDSSSRKRAELARASFELGHHAEVYASLEEFLSRPPASGIVLVREDGTDGGTRRVLRGLARSGVWLPVVAMSEEPAPKCIVSSIKAGAVDFLRLPLVGSHLNEMLDKVAQEAKAFGEARRRMIDAQGRIATLSNREREVLDWLSEGSSNKIIARKLEISPRTVEIHRANMMTKLGARHSAQAIRMQIEAQMGARGRM